MLAEMSEIVRFVVHYGAGTVRTNHMGVDLSEFKFVELDLPDPETVSLSQAKDYFTTSFGLDPQMYTVSMQALWTNSRTEVMWELKMIDRNSQWIHWLQGCKRRGTGPVLLLQPVFKAIPSRSVHPGQGCERRDEVNIFGSSSAAHADIGLYESGQSSHSVRYGESGEADGDEAGEEMQNLMAEEDADGSAEDLDSDDSDEEEVGENEEEVPMPGSWNQDFSEEMSVRDDHDSTWEYHVSNIAIGAMYPSKKHLKEAITQWAMSTQRVFRTDVSSQKFLTMTCRSPGCPARVHGYVPKYDVKWVVSDLVPHSCVIPRMLADHKNLTSSLVAQLLFNEIVQKKAMPVKAIQDTVKIRYKYTISYGKAWRAKQKALEDRFGSFFDSYDCVVRLLQTLQTRNPGTYVDIQHMWMPEFPTVKVLHRLFFSFGVCIEAFSHCRPLLCVDGTFLTGKYKGQILTAIGTDGNNQILPLAFAFVEGETTESWLWFLRQLKVAVVKDRPNVCILHDRHAGLLKAIKKLQQPEDDEPTPWNDLQSRWCMRHLGANFFSQFRSKNLMNLFKKLCKQNQDWKFNVLRSKLNEFSRAQVRERKAAQATAVAAHAAAIAAHADVEPEGLCDLPGFDPPGTRRKPGRRIKNFEEWIQHEPPEKWSLLHDTHGARYGTMTTNLAEVYNFVLRGNRALPLTAIVEGIFHGTVKYFRERRQRAELHMMNYPNTPYCEKVMRYMQDKMEKARSHTVIAIGNRERRFEVRLPTDKFGTGNQMRTHEVIIGLEAWPTCECTCNKPKLLHLPCSHVLAACGQLQMDAISFVSTYYRKESVINTWTGEMVGFRVVDNFNTVNPTDRQYIPDPGLVRTSRGRRQSRRIRNDMDESEAGGPTRQCFLCNAFGHRDTNCPTFGTGGAGSSRARRGRGRGRT